MNSPMVQTFRKFRDSWALLRVQVMFLKHEQSPFSCNCAEYRKNPTFFWAGKEYMHSSNNIFMEAKQFFLMPHKTFQAAIHSTSLLPHTLHDKQGVQLVCKCTTEVPWRAFARKLTTTLTETSFHVNLKAS